MQRQTFYRRGTQENRLAVVALRSESPRSILKKGSDPNRRGWLSMELVFVLPILLFMLLGMLEFSLLFFARSEVTEAARTGARTAMLSGVTEEDVISAIRNTLSPRLHGGLNIHVDLGEQSGDPVGVAVRVPMQNASPDLLWPIGYSLQSQYLYAETSYVKE